MATARQRKFLTALTGEDWDSIVGEELTLLKSKASWLIDSLKNIRRGSVGEERALNKVTFFIRQWFPNFSLENMPSEQDVSSYYCDSRPIVCVEEEVFVPTGLVYFIVGEGCDLVKIGHSARDLPTRLSELQTGSPLKLKILFNFRGSQKEEAILRRRFAKYHSHNEWFRIEGELKAFIEEHTNK
jgi:hypothetical protein